MRIFWPRTACHSRTSAAIFSRSCWVRSRLDAASETGIGSAGATILLARGSARDETAAAAAFRYATLHEGHCQAGASSVGPRSYPHIGHFIHSSRLLGCRYYWQVAAQPETYR